MVYCKSYVAVKGSSVPTFLEDGGPVYLDNRLVGILILLAVTHGGYSFCIAIPQWYVVEARDACLWPTKSYHILNAEVMCACFTHE